MSDFNLSGFLEVDASDMVGGLGEAAGASDEFAETTEETNSSLIDFDANLAAASAALAGVGTAMTSVLDDTQELRESLGRTAASTELTGDSANELARSLSNATFPIEDVTATMDVLAQSGVESREEMKDLAPVFDSVADATGNSAEAIAEQMVPALRATGNDVADAEEHMDAFTFVARETTATVDDFSRILTKTDADLEGMGVGIDEAAAIMASLEEQGLESRQAMREFRQAAGGDGVDSLEDLNEELGISAEQFEENTEAVEDAEGATADIADAANDSLGAMDRLRATVDDMTLAAGDMLQPMSAAGPLLQGVGTAGLALATVNTGAVIPSFGGVVAAVSPLLPILIPLAAAGGALAVVFDDELAAAGRFLANVFTNDVIPAGRRLISQGFDVIQRRGEQLRQWFNKSFGSDIQAVGEEAARTYEVVAGNLGSAFDRVKAGVRTLRTTFDDELAILERIGKGTFDALEIVFDTGIDNAIEIVSIGLSVLRGDWSGALDGIKNIAKNNLNGIEQLFQNAINTVNDITGGGIDSLKSKLTGLTAWVSDTFDRSLTENFAAAFDAAVNAIGEAFDRIGFGALTDGLDTIAGHVRDLIDSLNSLSGVNIDVDVPSFDGLMDRAKSIVSPSGGSSGSGGGSSGGGAGAGVGDGDANSGIGGGGPSGGGSTGTGGDGTGIGGPGTGLATGGFVGGTGAAMLHAGERVLPESQVSDRGEASFDPDSVADGFDRSSAADSIDEVSRKLDAVVDALTSLDQGDVKQKDVLRALNVAFDRYGGRNAIQ